MSISTLKYLHLLIKNESRNIRYSFKQLFSLVSVGRTIAASKAKHVLINNDDKVSKRIDFYGSLLFYAA